MDNDQTLFKSDRVPWEMRKQTLSQEDLQKMYFYYTIHLKLRISCFLFPFCFAWLLCLISYMHFFFLLVFRKPGKDLQCVEGVLSFSVG